MRLDNIINKQLHDLVVKKWLVRHPEFMAPDAVFKIIQESKNMPDQENGLTETIKDTAASPKLYEVDGEKTDSHSLPDLIEADKYLANKAASKSPMAALKMFKIAAPGGR